MSPHTHTELQARFRRVVVCSQSHPCPCTPGDPHSRCVPTHAICSAPMTPLSKVEAPGDPRGRKTDRATNLLLLFSSFSGAAAVLIAEWEREASSKRLICINPVRLCAGSAGSAGWLIGCLIRVVQRLTFFVSPSASHRCSRVPSRALSLEVRRRRSSGS